MKFFVSVVLITVLLCAGCGGISNTTKGGIIGAGSGAVIGTAITTGINGPAAPVILGSAILGGIIGALIGSDWDNNDQAWWVVHALDNLPDGESKSYIDERNRIFEVRVVKTEYAYNGISKTMEIKGVKKTVKLRFVQTDKGWGLSPEDSKKWQRIS